MKSKNCSCFSLSLSLFLSHSLSPDVFFAGITNKKEGESVTLHTGVNEVQKHDAILWMFGLLSPDTFIAEINITVHKVSYSVDGRFRDRLQLDDQTESLTITKSRTTNTGVYQLQITNSKETFYKRYNVFVGEYNVNHIFMLFNQY